VSAWARSAKKECSNCWYTRTMSTDPDSKRRYCTP